MKSKYIKKFELNKDFTQFLESNEYSEPHVSIIKNNSNSNRYLHYNTDRISIVNETGSISNVYNRYKMLLKTIFANSTVFLKEIPYADRGQMLWFKSSLSIMVNGELLSPESTELINDIDYSSYIIPTDTEYIFIVTLP